MKQNGTTYFSAEFQLENPGIYYHFKLRKNEAEPLFVLITKNSKAVSSLKQGALVPMIFHYQDKTIPSDRRHTRIKYVLDGNPIGFANHFMIGLDIDRIGE